MRLIEVSAHTNQYPYWGPVYRAKFVKREEGREVCRIEEVYWIGVVGPANMRYPPGALVIDVPERGRFRDYIR